MKNHNISVRQQDFRFNLEETAGAVGDFGTLLPIVLGVSFVSNVNVGHMLLFFSIWYILTGLYFKLPMPVEPMKAIGAIVITEGLNSGDIVVSGSILGIFFFLLGLCRAMSHIKKKIPTSVIRGIQLGLALLLFETSIHFIIGDIIWSSIGIMIIVLPLLVNKFYTLLNISAILVFLLGIAVGFFKSGIPSITLLSFPNIIFPKTPDLLQGLWLLAIPQAPLTITNAVLATTVLFQDLFKKDISPDELATSIGLMNLFSVPFGGFPMCHGAGGLAAQYRFGARTGGSNIISGLILLPIALFFASQGFLALIPSGIYGALLVFTAIELARSSSRTDSYIVTGITSLSALLSSMSVAFFIGMIAAYLMKNEK